MRNLKEAIKGLDEKVFSITNDGSRDYNQLEATYDGIRYGIEVDNGRGEVKISALVGNSNHIIGELLDGTCIERLNNIMLERAIIIANNYVKGND